MKRSLAIAILSAAGAMPAAAQSIIGLSGDKTLVMIDPASAAVTGSIEVQDVDRLLGIDYRPSNGTIVGVTADHRVMTIDPATGAATEISKMTTMLPSTDGAVVVDFNPMADRLRFMTGTTNHRVNVDTGEVTVDGSLAYEVGDMHAGEAPDIVAAAYVNSYGKPEKTAMFDIDRTISALIRQTSPNDGTLAAVGKLGVTLDGPVGFDVATDAEGNNTAWLVALGGLHKVNLETGAVAETWPLSGAGEPLRDVTVIPSM